MVEEFATGFPGYNSDLARERRADLASAQRQRLCTAAFGKWHNTPQLGNRGRRVPSITGPRIWAFEYFYGFLGGDTNQWAPELIENTKRIEPPHEPGYHF